MRKLLFSILLTFFFCANGWGVTETHYCCSDGNGAGATDGSSWANCFDGFDDVTWGSDDADDGNVGPNDDLLLRDDDGDYREQLSMGASGLSGKSITVKADTGESPVINAGDAKSTSLSENFDDNDISDWATSGGIAAANQRLEATISGGGTDDAQKSFAPTTRCFATWKVLINSSGLSGWDNGEFIGLGGIQRDSDEKQFMFAARNDSGTYKWYYKYATDAGHTETTLAGTTISLDTWYTIKLFYKAASGEGQDDGIAIFWINDVKYYESLSVDNDTIDFDEARLGNQWSSTLNAVTYTDDFEAYTGDAGVRDYCIYIVDKDYIVIDGLDLENALSTNVLIGGTSDNITIKNCSIHEFARFGIGIYDNAGGSNLFDNNTIYNIRETGINANPHKGSGSGTETIVSDNEVYDCDDYGMYLRVNYYIIENNEVHDCGHVWETGQEFWGIGIYSTAVDDGSGDHNILRYNFVYNITSAGNEGTALEFDRWCDNNEMYCNIGYNCDGRCITNYDAGTNKIYNNTCYGNSQNSSGELVTFAEISLTSTGDDLSTNLYVKNNAVYAKEANTYAIYVDDETYDNTLDIDTNDWYATATNWYFWNASGGNNLATWNALTGVGTDKNSDPLFVDAENGDFTLQSTSPCIDAGYDTGYDEGLHPKSLVPPFYLLNQNSFGDYDIGAYIYAPVKQRRYFIIEESQKYCIIELQ